MLIVESDNSHGFTSVSRYTARCKFLLEHFLSTLFNFFCFLHCRSYMFILYLTIQDILGSGYNKCILDTNCTRMLMVL